MFFRIRSYVYKPFYVLVLGLIIALPPLVYAQSDWAKQALKRMTSPHLGLPKLEHPKDNPPSNAKLELGRKLFFDARLSRDNKISCATCHNPKQAFTQTNQPTSTGYTDLIGRRNAPTLLNTHIYERYFQDGRETSLETQIVFPFTAPNEMANPSMGFVINKLKLLDEYPPLFQKAFGKEPSIDTIGQALAVYQRTLISANSRFDQWYYGNKKQVLTSQERIGFELFSGKAKCVTCHTIDKDHAIFTDQAFHDIGYGWQRQQRRKDDPSIPRDLGRFEVTPDPLDKWRYRTPTLRNIAQTAPYMHDGGLKTLTEVVQFYNQGGAPHKGQDHRIKPLNLDDQDVANIVAFLKSLTGEKVLP